MGFGKILSQLGIGTADADKNHHRDMAAEKSPLYHDFIEVLEKEADREQSFRCAARLMAIKNYADSLEAYRLLQQRFPERRSCCEINSGIISLLQEEYKQAFDYFLAAKIHGADEEESERHIWDACTGILSKSTSNRQKSECIDLYIRLFPKGRHVQEAQKLLAIA